MPVSLTSHEIQSHKFSSFSTVTSSVFFFWITLSIPFWKHVPLQYSGSYSSVNHEKNTMSMSSWHWYFNHFPFHYWALENQRMVNIKLIPLPHKAHNKSSVGQRQTVHTQGRSVRPLHTEVRYTAQRRNLPWKILARILSVKTLHQQLQMWPLIDALH